MNRRIRRLLVLAPLALVGTAGLLVAVTAVRAAGLPRYWREQAAAPASAEAVRIVALGDSAMVGVGALDPANGIASRVAADTTATTGRPVHLVNLARNGATVGDVLGSQLDQAELGRADLVIVQTSNDAQKKIPLPTYRTDLDRLLALVPAERTVLGDVPLLPGRRPYQQVMDELASDHHVRVARSSEVFRHQGRRLDVFSALPPHLNDRGYGYWASAFLPHARAVLGRTLR